MIHTLLTWQIYKFAIQRCLQCLTLQGIQFSSPVSDLNFNFALDSDDLWSLKHKIMCFKHQSFFYSVIIIIWILESILTFIAHCLHSSSLKQFPITSGHSVCIGLLFRSNHLSCSRSTQLRGKLLSWLLYKSSRLSWLRLPNSVGSSVRAFLLKSSRTKCRKVQNASWWKANK